jgi:hypothetical protein
MLRLNQSCPQVGSTRGSGRVESFRNFGGSGQNLKKLRVFFRRVCSDRAGWGQFLTGGSAGRVGSGGVRGLMGRVGVSKNGPTVNSGLNVSLTYLQTVIRSNAAR